MKTSSTVVKYFKNIKGLICLFIAICYGIDGMSQSLPFPSNPLINLGTFHSNNDSSQRYILNTSAFLVNMTVTDTLDSVFKVYVNNQLLDSLSPMKRLPVEIPKSLLHAGNNDIQIDMMLGNNLNILAQTQQFSLFVCEPYTLNFTSSPSSPVTLGTPVAISTYFGLSSNVGTQFNYSWYSSPNTITINPAISTLSSTVVGNLVVGLNSIYVNVIDENGCTGTGNTFIQVICTPPVGTLTIEDYNITTDKILNNSTFISNQDIVIKKGVTLSIQNTTILFDPCKRIIVERGAKLIVDNSNLTTCGSHTWLGIEAYGTNFIDRNPSTNYINGSAYIEFRNNSQISYAEIGILAGKRDLQFGVYMQDFGGAILKLSNTRFIFNQCHLGITKFDYPNLSSVENCLFGDIFPSILRSFNVSNPINYGPPCFEENDNLIYDRINYSFNINSIATTPPNFPFPNQGFYDSYLRTNRTAQLIYICGNKNLSFKRNKYTSHTPHSGSASYHDLNFQTIISSEDINFYGEEIIGYYENYAVISKSKNIEYKECIFDNLLQLNQSYNIHEIAFNENENLKVTKCIFKNALINGGACLKGLSSTVINMTDNAFEGVGHFDAIQLEYSQNINITSNKFNGHHYNSIILKDIEQVFITQNIFDLNVDFNNLNISKGKSIYITNNTTELTSSFGLNLCEISNSENLIILENKFLSFGTNGSGSLLDIDKSENISVTANQFKGDRFLNSVKFNLSNNFLLEENDIRSECETGIFILKSSGTGNSVTPYSRLTSNSIKSGRMQNGIHINNSKDIFLSRTSIDIENPLRFDPEQLAYYGFSPLMTTGFGIQLTNQSENVVIQNSPLIKSSHCGVGYFNGIPTRNDNWLDHNIINECDYGLLISYFKDPTLFTYPTQQTAKHRLKTFCNTFNTRIADIIGYGDWVDQGSTSINAGNTFSITPMHPNISWHNTTSVSFNYYGTANQHSGSFEVHKQSSIFSLPPLYAEHGAVNNSFQTPSTDLVNCRDISIKPSYYRSANSTSSNDKISNIDLKLFPNPTKNLVEINSQMLLHNVTVMDIYGKIYKEWIRVNKQHLQIDLSDLANGVYFVKISDAKDQISIEKIVKNE